MYWRPGGNVGRVTKYGRVIGFEVVGERGEWTEWKLWGYEVRLLRLLEYLGRGSSRGWVSVSYFRRCCGLGAQSLTNAMRVLVWSGLVRRRKIGYRMYYSVSRYGLEVLGGVPDAAWGGVSVEDDFADVSVGWDLGL